MRKKILLMATVCAFMLANVACSCLGGLRRPVSGGEKPTTTPAGEEISYEENVEIILDAALDYMVPSTEPSATISNTIIESTKYEVLYADDKKCTIKVKYPDVAAIVKEECSKSGDEVTKEIINDILKNVVSDLSSGKVTMIEKTFEAKLETDEDGNSRIVWTDELLDAFSGGLYSGN